MKVSRLAEADFFFVLSYTFGKLATKRTYDEITRNSSCAGQVTGSPGGDSRVEAQHASSRADGK